VYSDNDRFAYCDTSRPINDLDAHSKVYDIALILICSYHIIEWVRMTMFLITLILGQNLIPLWYLTFLNTLFGIAAYIVVHVARFSEPGKTCADT
jgi:hypothetical protein